MNRLQLATLLSWAGDNGLDGRKRLQKIVYFLQYAGCDLGCRYILHHYGPYSRDVADTCDEMVAAGLIDQGGGPAEGRMQYTYQLPQKTQQLLDGVSDQQMNTFETLGKRLIGEEVWPLELGSTILFFYEQGWKWEDALTEACAYKKADAANQVSRDALALAQEVHASRSN